ncbi:protein FAM180B-like isoform X1 [Melanerpes formicivorus]|uniref:protein FAM180B isoform X1 n=1 Tax=Melanerpes formicivorus TaxID=211600 RepID=UPI00358EAC3A
MALASRRQGPRQSVWAAMARARLGNWLILCVLAGSQRLTDEHPHRRDSTVTSIPHHGPEDADIMLEMLWGGLDVQANEKIQLQDEELASLRPVRRLMHILEDEVPKTPPEVEQHLRYYSVTDAPLPAMQFDRLLLTSVYCAYQPVQDQERDVTRAATAGKDTPDCSCIPGYLGYLPHYPGLYRNTSSPSVLLSALHYHPSKVTQAFIFRQNRTKL